MSFNRTQILEIVNQELPIWLEKDKTIKEALEMVMSEKFAGKRDTHDRFEEMLKENRMDRERSDKRWEENNRKWEEDNKKWYIVWDEIKKLGQKHDQTLGALGARWGTRSEKSYRNALIEILKDFNPGNKVVNFKEKDKEGIVFGYPEEVEIDVIIKNGKTYLIEIKSSVSLSDIITFINKVKYYEKKEKRKVQKSIVISPMISSKAKDYATKNRIIIYSYARKLED